MAVGTVLQKCLADSLQSLAFFSKIPTPTQGSYSLFSHELLSIYVPVRYFHHTVEVQSFTIFTDHNPLTYARD